MTLRYRFSLTRRFAFPAAFAIAMAAASAAACGGTIAVDPIGGAGPTEGTPPASSAPTEGTPPGPSTAPTTPTPKAPIGPYLGLVGTTDVSILYPLPPSGQSKDFVRPTESGDHGVLFSKDTFDTVVNRGQLDSVVSDPPSGYTELGLVSLRLDPCSARGQLETCPAEVRLVFQALYEKTDTDPDGDSTVGSAATDGAVHVAYGLPKDELIIMMKQILTLKAAEGGLASSVLEPHPILAAQGLSGAFAKGLRAILLEHLGEARIARVTTFDHNFEPDGDGWRFRIFDKVGAAFAPRNVIQLNLPSQLIFGSSAFQGPLATTSVGGFAVGPVADDIAPLLQALKPEPGSAQAAALRSAFDAALRIQSPDQHNSESTDCASCHLAEGARLIGESMYSFAPTGAFTHPRSLDYKSERVSVTNVHAFGYLHRKVSIMQRTANESAVVAERMEKILE